MGLDARFYPVRLGTGTQISKQVPRLFNHTVAYASASSHLIANVHLEPSATRELKVDSVDYWLQYAHDRIEFEAQEAEDRCPCCVRV